MSCSKSHASRAQVGHNAYIDPAIALLSLVYITFSVPLLLHMQHGFSPFRLGGNVRSDWIVMIIIAIYWNVSSSPTSKKCLFNNVVFSPTYLWNAARVAILPPSYVPPRGSRNLPTASPLPLSSAQVSDRYSRYALGHRKEKGNAQRSCAAY